MNLQHVCERLGGGFVPSDELLHPNQCCERDVAERRAAMLHRLAAGLHLMPADHFEALLHVVLVPVAGLVLVPHLDPVLDLVAVRQVVLVHLLHMPVLDLPVQS